MTTNKLASLICAREGKTHEASVGDVREIIKVICTMEAEAVVKDPESTETPLHALAAATVKIVDRLRKRAKR